VKRSREVNTREIERFQKNEITEHFIYKNLSSRVKGVKNRRVLAQIADDEMRHYTIWKHYTGRDVAPGRFRIWFYTLVSMLFGFTFGIRLMEKGEKNAHAAYSMLLQIGRASCRERV